MNRSLHYLLIAGALFLQSPRGISQMNIDSLQTALANEKGDSLTIAGYLESMTKLQSTDVEAKTIMAKWTLQKAEKLKNPYLIALANLRLGAIYFRITVDLPLAFKYLTEAESIANKNQFWDLESRALNFLSNIYLANKQYEKHEEMTLKCIDICKKANIADGLAAAYANLSSVYAVRSIDKPEYLPLAIQYRQQSIRTGEELKDTVNLINNYMLISSLYLDRKKDFDSTRFMLANAGKYIRESNKNSFFSKYFYYAGNLLQAERKFPEAIYSYQQGIDTAIKYKYITDEMSLYKEIAKTYKATGDYRNAFLFTEKYRSISDSILSKENFAKATDFQNKYEREKKDRELLQKGLELKTASGKRIRLTIFLASALFVLVLLGIFSALLLKNIRARKKAYSLLEEKSIKIQEQARELTKQARLIAKFQSQMNPHFVFNALHNIQGLVVGQENKKATSQIQALAQLMRKTFANAEKDDIPLQEEISYLQKYIDFERSAFENKLQFDVETKGNTENVLIPPMMIQPFVENAIKHAGLKKVENPYINVLIEIEDHLLSISVKDNGAGMKRDNNSPDMLAHSMSVIKARIQLLFQEKSKVVNGNLFSVKTVPDVDMGTLVKFYLPLNYSY